MKYRTNSRIVTAILSLNLLWPINGVIWRDITTHQYWLIFSIAQQDRPQEERTEEVPYTEPEQISPFVPYEEDQIPQYTPPTEPRDLPRITEPPLLPTPADQPPTAEPEPSQAPETSSPQPESSEGPT